MREYVEDCFGVSMYAPGELKRIEERLCSGTHWDSILHFTRGEMKPLDRNNREAIVQRSSAKRQSELNRKYFTDDIVRNRLTIARLAEKIRNCMLVHLDDARIKSRAARWRRRRSGAEWRWATRACSHAPSAGTTRSLPWTSCWTPPPRR